MEHFEGCSFRPEIPEGCDLKKDRILLHCCCGPCSTAILEWMVEEGLRPGLFFSNSNIVPFDEYVKRRDELVRYAATFGQEVADDEYDHSAWLEFVRSRCGSTEVLTGPERGPRCLACFEFRLRRAAEYAATNGYSILTTTLASSRWKVLSQVDDAGRRAVLEFQGEKQNEQKLIWWPQNWRKGGLQERRNLLIKSCALYNQTWCGCEFSMKLR
ncbi:MAG: epoxyqueuosine reductase QueH [Bacteroidales bacterium]|nr:epoxyqueuosine reductase QueH [Bacteroidales bacterium]